MVMGKNNYNSAQKTELQDAQGNRTPTGGEVRKVLDSKALFRPSRVAAPVMYNRGRFLPRMIFIRVRTKLKYSGFIYIIYKLVYCWWILGARAGLD